MNHALPLLAALLLAPPAVLHAAEPKPASKPNILILLPVDINLDGDNRGNQYAPLLVSSKGRYVWCEKAFRFEFKDRSLRVTSAGNTFHYGQAGRNLRDAYRHASKRFFPTDGKLPDRALFAMPQYNIPDMIAAGLLGYTFVCPDMIGGGEFTSFLNQATIDQDLIVRSAQVHALAPMMQFSVAPWRVLDAAHLAAVKRAVALRMRFTPRILDSFEAQERP